MSLLEQIAARTRSTGLLVRTFRYPCGHEHDTALLTPPRECPKCRYARDREELAAKWERNQNRKSATEKAESAHDFGKPHMVCYYCVESIKADMYAFGERLADIFSKRIPRGFKR